VNAGHPVRGRIGRPACLGDRFCWFVLCAHGCLSFYDGSCKDQNQIILNRPR
jgi:hypothetical protein